MVSDAANRTALAAADWLCLAAAPAFAAMAALTAMFGGDMPICSAGPDAFALGGMVPMYVLMAAVHAAPWLRLISARRTGAARTLKSAPR